MAVEGDRNGIPVRLNRIRTRPILPEDQSSSGGDDSPAPLVVGRVLPAVAVWKLDGVNQGSGDENRVVGGRKGLRKGRKIARWFSSYFATKSPYKAFRSEVQEPDVKMLNKKDNLGAKGSINSGYRSQEQVILENSSPGKVSKSQKSFSHELGPRGGIRPALVRTYSYRDLKELLGSPHSKFDAAKELMNSQLAAFVVDVMDALEKDFYPREQQVAEDQQILAQKCIEMTSSQFREECERIVKNLAETRPQCQSDSLKQLITRMLLILTPCTRLLQFQKDSGPISEESLDRFKQCLDSLPAIDIKRVSKPAMQENSFTKYQLNKSEIAFCPPQSTIGTDPCNLSYPESQKVFPSNHEHAITACHKTDSSFTNKMVHEDSLDSFHEHDEHHQGSDSVICRICEENIPASHWKFHFYICACADQCDIENLEIDGCLIRIAELLEQIVEFYNKSCLVSCNIPETSWMQSDNAEIGSECRSSIAQEFYNEGMEGMFEELHEMDTACLNDSHISTYKNLKSFLAKKFGTCLHTSLNETTMPASCTNTPRSSHSDSSWLEDNNPSEHEDVNQMNEMADIARKAANIDPGNKKVFELLNVCLLDLDDILQHSRLKALMIDTFGNRIKHILEEKYLLAKQLLDEGRDKTIIQREEIRGTMMVNESKFSASTALPPLHKDRTSIDDFDIMKPISRGAFGRVLLARKRTTGDLFAVKVLKKLHMIRKNDVDRMLAERDILVKVRNPFVVRFFYSFTSRDNLYLVMEYLNGGDLYSLLRKVGCLEEDVARTYIAELVLALEYLHSLGIIHRDLKPDNILIAQDGHIKLTDFGLSKIGLMNSAINLSGSGVTGSVPLDAQNHLVFPVHAQQRVKRSRSSAVGTPDYLAPEILLGTAHGYAADWWSVGIILFELITGIPPFTDRLPEMIFDNILNGNIPWPCVPEDMSYEAKDLIGRLLIQDQDQRLGANGASEVKAHPFFKEINWDNLSLQKAAFIPHPDSADDTSYFMPRYSEGSSQVAIANNSSDCTSDATKSSSDTGVETTVEKCSGSKLSDSCTSSLDFSSLRFSFKNRSELASMTYDVLLQSGKSSKCSSPSNGSYS